MHQGAEVGHRVTDISEESGAEYRCPLAWRVKGRGQWRNHRLNRTCLSPTPQQATTEEDRAWRQDFGDPAAGFRAGDFAMQCSFLSDRIFSCFTGKGIVRTESDDRYEKHFGNCKTLFKCKVLFLLPSVSLYRM